MPSSPPPILPLIVSALTASYSCMVCGGWLHDVLCCAVLCCAVLCCAVLCCAVLCCLCGCSMAAVPPVTTAPSATTHLKWAFTLSGMWHLALCSLPCHLPWHARVLLLFWSTV